MMSLNRSCTHQVKSLWKRRNRWNSSIPKIYENHVSLIVTVSPKTSPKPTQNSNAPEKFTKLFSTFIGNTLGSNPHPAFSNCIGFGHSLLLSCTLNPRNSADALWWNFNLGPINSPPNTMSCRLETGWASPPPCLQHESANPYTRHLPVPSMASEKVSLVGECAALQRWHLEVCSDSGGSPSTALALVPNAQSPRKLHWPMTVVPETGLP